MRVLILSADGFEDSELLLPWSRLQEENVDVDIASPTAGSIRGKHGYEAPATLAIDDVRAEDYDAVIVPGGRAPARLCRSAKVLDLIRTFVAAGKPVSAICHGPEVLISAGVLRGRSATCYRTVAGRLEAAGAHYRDAEVVVDGNLITSRQPSDLPAFMRETVKKLRQWQARGNAT